ncbi:hypothetical protein QZH41_017847 [Actinostola sp. cb2023]|nr:hypothetical protein QZH41_017847 [Actinostola sp. cb2023]
MNHHGATDTLESVPLRDTSPASHGQSPEGNDHQTLSPHIRFQQELRNDWCQFCREIQIRIYRSVTIRGLPRLFLLKRLFCLYWIIVVCLFIFLKLYFPLYLTSTVSRNTLEEFRTDWCRVRKARNDWTSLLSPCEYGTQWGRHLEGWSKANSTDPNMSYISLMNIKAAGEFSRFTIQTQTSDGRLKQIGGDSWRIQILGPSSLAPTIIDHKNGTYEVLFLVMEPGEYRVVVFLDYTLCQGFKDPPDSWFIAGNIHGAAQRPGILGDQRHYLNEPLWQGVPLTFKVQQARGPLRKDEFLSYGFGNPVSCGAHCNLLWDGYGRWTNGTWAPYVSDSLMANPVPRRQEGVLWIYGDSNALRLHKSIQRRHLCTSIFKHCNSTYNWVYTVRNATIEKRWQDFRDFDVERVVTELKAVLYRPEMNDSKSVLVLNFGLHFISAVTFASYQRLVNRTIEVVHELKEGMDGMLQHRFHGDVIWKSTTSMNREKIANPHYIGRRFMTRQRVVLFNAYASWAMCRAGIKILDVYPISASYPGGTGLRRNMADSIHFRNCVFESAVTLLENYYGNGVYFERFEHSCHNLPGN